MQALSILQNDNTFVVTIDKEKVSNDKLNLIEKLLLSIISGEKLKVDKSNIHPVSAQEQAEIEAILNAIPPEDREIAFSKEIEFEL